MINCINQLEMEFTMNTNVITIRQAQPADATELQKLNDLFNGAGCNSLENIADSLNTNTREIIFVAADGESLVGFCCAQMFRSMCYPMKYAEITELFVVDRCRGHGIGRRLLSTMETELMEHGARHFHILTSKDNVAAKALYLSFGFAETTEIILDKG